MVVQIHINVPGKMKKNDSNVGYVDANQTNGRAKRSTKMSIENLRAGM